MYNKLLEQANFIKSKTGGVTPCAAVILGSGLSGIFGGGGVAVDYKDIPGFPRATVSGHKGKIQFTQINGVNAAVFEGRLHYYEGHSIQDTVSTVRVAKLLGAELLFLTNAAGAANPEFRPGDIMLIKDHISLAPNPLIGANLHELGPRFPDVSNLYDKQLFTTVKTVAKAQKIAVKEGVYVQFTGPSYETAAEVRMARILGGDAVGMSTAAEAVAACHAGLRVAGLSVITNMGTGLSADIAHDEVVAIGKGAGPKIAALIGGCISKICA